ncbi:MAG: MBL fold metallo-hydrolase [Candidatus Micrarchaeota archaeon]|nr:MBL fold metallo-hydrolase [Candidatus Micrarchaeota archaeon]
MIEAITYATNKKRGILFGPKTLFNKKLDFGISLSKYHARLLNEVVILSPKKKVKYEDFELLATNAKHDNTRGIGFILHMDGKSIGYTGDTEYFPGISDQYKDLDLLIVNILRADNEWAGHLDKKSCLRLIKECKPKTVILTRFGGEYIRTRAEDVAKWLSDKSKIKVIASYDGMSFNI